MSRHSKNNTANSVFTHGEKQMLEGWGTITQRLGAESFRPFSSCSLCLNPAKSAVCCQKGHIYCKECLLLSFLKQKNDLKVKIQAYESYLAHKASENLSKQSSLSKSKLQHFEATEAGRTAHQAWLKFDEERKYQQMSNADKEHAKAKALLQCKDKKPATNQELIEKNFWVPEKTPEDERQAVEKPSKDLICPEGAHKIKRKKLVELVVDADPKTGNLLCGACLSQFTHQKGWLLKCGHLFCGECWRGEVCLKCGVKIRKKEIIEVLQSGTMFAAHNQVEATVFKAVFQC